MGTLTEEFAKDEEEETESSDEFHEEPVKITFQALCKMLMFLFETDVQIHRTNRGDTAFLMIKDAFNEECDEFCWYDFESRCAFNMTKAVYQAYSLAKDTIADRQMDAEVERVFAGEQTHYADDLEAREDDIIIKNSDSNIVDPGFDFLGKDKHAKTNRHSRKRNPY